MLKAAIALMLIATVASLFSGLFFLVKDEGHSNRLVKIGRASCRERVS